jgi:hypothetical protein
MTSGSNWHQSKRSPTKGTVTKPNKTKCGPQSALGYLTPKEFAALNAGAAKINAESGGIISESSRRRRPPIAQSASTADRTEDELRSSPATHPRLRNEDHEENDKQYIQRAIKEKCIAVTEPCEEKEERHTHDAVGNPVCRGVEPTAARRIVLRRPR